MREVKDEVVERDEGDEVKGEGDRERGMICYEACKEMVFVRGPIWARGSRFLYGRLDKPSSIRSR